MDFIGIPTFNRMDIGLKRGVFEPDRHQPESSSTRHQFAHDIAT